MDGAPIPDYADGRIGNSERRNYLAHPPLYYSTLGVLCRVADIDPIQDYKKLRMLSACFVALGFFYWLLTAARAGLKPPLAAAITLAICAVPMFGFVAGSINNDTLLYLGPGLLFYALSPLLTGQNATRYSGLALWSGIIITFLTKATASAFVVFFLVFLFRGRLREASAILRQRCFAVPAMAALVPCAFWYAYALIAHGQLMPAPSALYPESAPADPMVPARFAMQYAMVMWERLPAIVSHASVMPFVSKGATFFYAMFLIPFAGWAIGRLAEPARRIPSRLLHATDAFLLATMTTVVLHLAVCYRGYMDAGLMAGLQPRYFLFLLPALWIVAFSIEPPRRARIVTMAAFTACAAIAFWTSVPFTLSKQESTVAAMRKATVAAPPPKPGQGMQGHLDEIRLSAGRLELRGWAYDVGHARRAQRIIATARGKLLATLPIQTVRDDVGKALGNPGARQSGFAGVVSGLEPGLPLCAIEVEAEMQDGQALKLRGKSCE